MTLDTFHWTVEIAGRIPGGARGYAEGFSREPELALDAVRKHLKKLFPAAPTAQFKLYAQRPDQTLFEVHGGSEYTGMLGVSAIPAEELLKLSLDIERTRNAGKPVVYHNPRARNNFLPLLIAVAEQLAVAIVTSLGAATWHKVSAMSIPARAAWLEKNASRLAAVQSLGLSLLGEKLMNMIPTVPEKRKAMWLEVATLMGDPSIQEAAQEAGKAVTAAATAPRAKNNFLGFGKSKEPALPTLSFQDAATRGTAMEKQARSRFGLSGRGTTHFVIKAPSPGGRGPVWYFLDGVTAAEMDRASAWGVPKQYIDEKDPWLTVVSNIEAYGSPDAQNVVVLDTYADTISGPFNREEVWKLAKMGRTPPAVRRNPKPSTAVKYVPEAPADYDTLWGVAEEYRSRKPRTDKERAEDNPLIGFENKLNGSPKDVSMPFRTMYSSQYREAAERAYTKIPFDIYLIVTGSGYTSIESEAVHIARSKNAVVLVGIASDSLLVATEDAKLEPFEANRETPHTPFNLLHRWYESISGLDDPFPRFISDALMRMRGRGKPSAAPSSRSWYNRHRIELNAGVDTAAGRMNALSDEAQISADLFAKYLITGRLAYDTEVEPRFWQSFYGSGGLYVDTYPVRLKQARRLYAENLKAHFDNLIKSVLASPAEKRVFYV